MNFDPGTIIIGIITSCVGWGYVRWGRAQAHIPAIIAGAGLMSYVYFVDTLVWQIVVGVVLAAVPFVWR